ncbi:hypothetical protein, partial [Acetobacter cerevisiae]|uniref:hypothetical protein n=1 Tax=Acetobacter cerevisiae TaxID=178900 RepID=UPI001E650E52
NSHSKATLFMGGLPPDASTMAMLTFMLRCFAAASAAFSKLFAPALLSTVRVNTLLSSACAAAIVEKPARMAKGPRNLSFM